MKNIETLTEKLSATLSEITNSQTALTATNAAIREAKQSGDAVELRKLLQESSEQSALLQALRESENDLRGQISQLESEAQAEQARQVREAKIKKFVNAARLANQNLRDLEDFEKSLPLELRKLFKQRQDLTEKLKTSVTKFWDLGSRENAWDGYESSRETPPEIRTLLAEIKSQVELKGVYAKFGPFGSSSALSNPAHFLSESYPITDELAPHFMAATPPRLHQGIDRLLFAKLEGNEGSDNDE